MRISIILFGILMATIYGCSFYTPNSPPLNAPQAPHRGTPGSIASGTRASSLDPYSDLILKGKKKVLEGDLNGAMDIFNKAISIDSSRHTGYFCRGIVEQKLLDYGGAMKDYEKARDLNPSDPEPYALLARMIVVYVNVRDKLPSARKNLERALEIDPGNCPALMGMAMTYMFQEKYQEAKDYLDNAIARVKDPEAPECADLFEERGFANYYLRNYREALDDFNRAERLDPENVNLPTIRVGRAMTNSRLGKWDEAVADLDAVKNTQELISIHAEEATISKILLYKGDFQRILDLNRYTYQTFPVIPDHVRDYAKILDNLGRVKESREIYRRLLQMMPNNPMVYLDLAESEIVWGKPDKAEVQFKKAMKIVEPEESEQELKGIAGGGARFDVIICYASFLASRNRFDEMEAVLKKISLSDNKEDVARLKDLGSCYYELSWLLQRKGMKEKADRYFKMAQKIMPEHPGYVVYKANRDVRDPALREKALASLKGLNVKAMWAADAVCDMYIKMAEIYAEAGLYKESIGYLEQAFKNEFPSQKALMVKHIIPESPYFKEWRKYPEFARLMKAENL